MSDVNIRPARSKVRPIAELGRIADEAHANNKSVALCHGVFDLVHLGHIRHIEAARAEGDLLMVTLTADRFVNKGPGRPIFPDNMRAEMLAALEYVDYVGINDNPTAEPVIDTIRPDVYVKGSDYENPEDDITGKIDDERLTVERHGGRLVYTKDITFSSSTLINRYLDVYDPPLRDLLDRMRSDQSLERLMGVLDKVRDSKVLLVGDAIIDEYQYVEAMGKAAKENILATLFVEREIFAGGIFAAANHVASFCREVEIITALGDDDSFEDVVRRNLKPNVTLNALRIPGRPTTRKTRFVENGYSPRKLFEVYTMNDHPLPQDLVGKLNMLIADKAKGADVVVVTDFGHGLIGASTVQQLIASAKFLAVNTQSNSGNHGYNPITKYPKADFFSIDTPEARLATRDKFSDVAVLIEKHLSERIDCDKIIITLGAHGCMAYEKGKGITRIPAF
ncbi:MAG: cytidyltransferase, partial [Rhodospirillales bacterium]